MDETSLKFVDLTEAHLDPILVLEQLCFQEPYSRQLWLDELRLDVAHPFFLMNKHEIVGFLDFWVVRGEGQLIKIAVSPKFRKQGIGAKLMFEMERRCLLYKADEILLEVRPSNKAALALYQKMGYQKTRVRKKYYNDNGEDAWEMIKKL